MTASSHIATEAIVDKHIATESDSVHVRCSAVAVINTSYTSEQEK